MSDGIPTRPRASRGAQVVRVPAPRAVRYPTRSVLLLARAPATDPEPMLWPDGDPVLWADGDHVLW